MHLCTEALTFTESVIVKYISQWTGTRKILLSYFTQQADMATLIIFTWISNCNKKSGIYIIFDYKLSYAGFLLVFGCRSGTRASTPYGVVAKVAIVVK